MQSQFRRKLVLLYLVVGCINTCSYGTKKESDTQALVFYKGPAELKTYALTGAAIGAGVNVLSALCKGGRLGAGAGYGIGIVGNSGPRGTLAGVSAYIAVAGFFGLVGAGVGAVTGGLGGSCCYGGKQIGRQLFTGEYAWPLGAVVCGTLFMRMPLRYGFAHSIATVAAVELFSKKADPEAHAYKRL